MEHLTPGFVRTSSVIVPVYDGMRLAALVAIELALVTFVAACLVLSLRLSLLAGELLLIGGVGLSLLFSALCALRQLLHWVKHSRTA